MISPKMLPLVVAEDVNLYETMKKAEARATGETLGDLARQLAELLETTPQ
jgi:hypothetical protein